MDSITCVKMGNEASEWFFCKSLDSSIVYHVTMVLLFVCEMGVVKEVQARKLGREAQLVGDGKEKLK